MKLRNIGRILAVGTIALVMAGCSGGSSSSSSSTPPPTPTNPGGTASAPAVISFDYDNIISSSHFNNYFQYTGREGEKLIIATTLDEPISRNEAIECQMSSGKGMGIAVYDINFNYEPEYSVLCGTDMTFIFPTDTTYIFHFNNSSPYYGGNSGYFNAASVGP